MKTLHDVESKAIQELDTVCDAAGIDCHPYGTRIRGVLLKATLDAYRVGAKMVKTLYEQDNCKHEYAYSNNGGVCLKCGRTTLQCCSD